MSGATGGQTPRLSTTVMVLRDAPELHVLMVARAQEIDFASGALVFPGGKVDPADRRAAWDGLAVGGFEGEARALRVAALRECFEEVGLLIARDAGGAGRGQAGDASAALIDAAQARALSDQRGPVERGEIAFDAVIAQAGLALALDRLTPFARWIAPEIAPKRFDTHFFLTALPEGQQPLSDGRETTEALWLSPAEALARAEEGRATIVFPTRMNLKRLSVCASTEEALARFGAAPPPVVRPEVVQGPDGLPCLTLPAEAAAAGYGPVLEPLSRVSKEVGPKAR